MRLSYLRAIHAIPQFSDDVFELGFLDVLGYLSELFREGYRIGDCAECFHTVDASKAVSYK